MSQEKRKVAVTIFGESYVVLGDNDPNHIEYLAALVDKKMKMIKERSPSLTATKIAVLTALNLADDYVGIKQEQQALDKLLNAGEKE